MQPRWHDPQPMAMVQHGGRTKLLPSTSPIEIEKTATAPPVVRDDDRPPPAQTEE